MKRFTIATVLMLALAGCEGRVETRDVLDNQGEARIDWWGRSTPSGCQSSTVQEILETGVARLAVEHRLIRVRYYDVARYRIEETRFYVGPSFLARSLLFPLYLIVLFPLDFMVGGAHIGPFPFAHAIFVMDSRWAPTGEIRVEKDVSITDWDESERTEPMPDASCDLIVRAGTTARDEANPLPQITVLHAVTGADGSCSFDLRPVAREFEVRHAGWTLEFEFVSRTNSPLCPSLILTEEQVTKLANMK